MGIRPPRGAVLTRRMDLIGRSILKADTARREQIVGGSNMGLHMMLVGNMLYVCEPRWTSPTPCFDVPGAT